MFLSSWLCDGSNDNFRNQIEMATGTECVFLLPFQECFKVGVGVSLVGSNSYQNSHCRYLQIINPDRVELGLLWLGVLENSLKK